MVIRIAIIDDDNKFIEQISNYLTAIQKETNYTFEISFYNNPLLFFNSFITQFDIIFMDIDMPKMDGLTGAKELRKIDKNVIIIFTTYLAQYTINGYEVNALDFILKPVKYSQFILKIKRAIKYISRDTGKNLLIKVKKETIVLNSNELIYIEVISHNLYFHTTRNVYTIRGTLKDLYKTLQGFPFTKCNKCYIVNLSKVTQIKNYDLYLNDVVLKISKSRKQDFMQKLTDFYGKRTFNLEKYQ